MARLPELTRNKVFRSRVRPNWTEDNQHFWYRVQTAADTYRFVIVDCQKGTRRLAFDHEQVLQQLRDATEDPSMELANAIVFNPEQGRVYLHRGEKYWAVDCSTNQLSETQASNYLNRHNAMRQLRPSADGGGDTNIEVKNLTAEPLQLIWIDRRGRRVPYQTIAPNQTVSQHTFVGHVWLVVDGQDRPLQLLQGEAGLTRVVIDSLTPLELETDDGPRRNRGAGRRGRSLSKRSPDGRRSLQFQQGRLSVRDEEAEQVLDLATLPAGSDSHFATSGAWSADSRYVLVNQIFPGQRREIVMVETAPRDQLQPKLHRVPYDKPGDQIEQHLPRLFDAQTGQELELDRKLLENPWSIRRIHWNDAAGEFRLLYNRRGHQVLRYIAIQPSDQANQAGAATRVIVDEQSETFIDYTNKVFLQEIHEGRELIWMSERDGWNHLYRYDAETGQVKNQITSGNWVVRGVDRVDEETGQIWFRAGGIVPGQDPYYVHYCRVNLDGSGLVRLTDGDGTHSIEFSPDRRYLLDTYSRVDLPPQTNLRRAADGKLVCELEQADWQELLKSGWRKPVPFGAPGRDGQTGIYGVIYFPTRFDEQQQYPVVEHIYAGPHSAFVPKGFSVHNQMRALAELGFIVVQIDGMGTSHRSKSFHDVCWKNLGDSGFPDRIRWLQAAAEAVPQMDLDRVGIYGGSAGGQSALRGLLAYPEFYKVAVADCGCHDNRMDKIWWNEQWMGWPVGPHYAEQSNVTNAHRLRGKLFLIVGELDRNVDPASTMQVVDALVKADKDFDLLVVPGAGHGIGSGSYGRRRTRDFFVRHLWNMEPRR